MSCSSHVCCYDGRLTLSDELEAIVCEAGTSPAELECLMGKTQPRPLREAAARLLDASSCGSAALSDSDVLIDLLFGIHEVCVITTLKPQCSRKVRMVSHLAQISAPHRSRGYFRHSIALISLLYAAMTANTQSFCVCRPSHTLRTTS